MSHVPVRKEAEADALLPMRLPVGESSRSVEVIADLTSLLLTQLGEDPDREGLVKTPKRVAEALLFLTSGYQMDIDEIINGAIFDENHDELVLVRNIDVMSLCEHHMLPFFGVCHVAYLPNRKVIGLSKVPRIVEAFSRRLQLQERLTSQIANCLLEALKPRGVAVVMDCSHMCMAMRGVQKVNARTTTSAMLGSFREDPRARRELLALIGRGDNH